MSVGHKLASSGQPDSQWELATFGQTRVWWRTQGRVGESVMVGNLSVEASQFLQGKLDLLIAAHPDVVGFHDWWDMPTYDSAARVSWQSWLSRARFAGAHFLTRSRLVQMGIIVANLAYPGVRFAVYGQRIEYDKARAPLMRPAVRPR